MKTINIKGRDYVMVNERIMFFRVNYPNYKMQTQMLSNENGVCVFRCVILNDNNEAVATGHAYEKEADKSSFVNATSYIENCETSAVGRALGMLGIGIENSIASAEDVVNAINQQSQSKPTIKQSVGAIWADTLATIESAYEGVNLDVCDAYGELINPKTSKAYTIDEIYNVTDEDEKERIVNELRKPFKKEKK